VGFLLSLNPLIFIVWGNYGRRTSPFSFLALSQLNFPSGCFIFSSNNIYLKKKLKENVTQHEISVRKSESFLMKSGKRGMEHSPLRKEEL
jgi:hypothetical protein